jgi:phosphate transport system protein
MLATRIELIKKELIGFAGLVEGMIDESLEGLIDREKELLTKVIEIDEPKSNKFEIELDELCISSIAQYQPKAKDLRTILMVLRINNDLERLGDHAVNIAESSLFLIERPYIKPLLDIPRMAQIAVKMLKDGINSFITENVEQAYNVIMQDSTVDGLRNQVTRELIMLMSSSPSTIERAFQLMRISSNLERIADLSTNICEDIIFMVQGKVVKHLANEVQKEAI